jgi:hypothetical protein
MEVGGQNRERSRFWRTIGDHDGIAWETIDADAALAGCAGEQTGGLSVRIATANLPMDYSIR